MELNPVEAKITKRVGEFRYTLLHDILKNQLRVCMRESFVLKWFDNTNELLKSLDIKMTAQEYKKIEQFQKEATAYKREPKKIMQKFELKDYFTKDLSKSQRDVKIQKATKDGFTQSEVARFLGLSASGVSRILKKSKVKP